MRTRLLAVAIVATWAVVAQAGEVETSYWPYSFVPQEVSSIPVVMDLPWWVWIRDLDKLVIRLLPRSPYEYEGCADVAFGVHSGLNISAEFIPTGAVAGRYSCWLSSPFLESSENTLGICVELKTETIPPAMTNVRVGTVRLRISPRS